MGKQFKNLEQNYQILLLLISGKRGIFFADSVYKVRQIGDWYYPREDDDRKSTVVVQSGG